LTALAVFCRQSLIIILCRPHVRPHTLTGFTRDAVNPPALCPSIDAVKTCRSVLLSSDQSGTAHTKAQSKRYVAHIFACFNM